VGQYQRGEQQRGELQRGEQQRGELQRGELQHCELQRGELQRGELQACLTRHPESRDDILGGYLSAHLHQLPINSSQKTLFLSQVPRPRPRAAAPDVHAHDVLVLAR
jgi:hypothetical protein